MAESRNNTTSLLDLPTDVICTELPQAIVSSSDATNIMKTLSSTYTGFYSLFQSELDKRAAQQLLTYVLKPTQANLEKAKKMYIANPRLLFIEATAYEYAAGLDDNLKNVYRKVQASPIRAMAGAGDIWLLKEVIETDEFKKYVDAKSKKTAHELAADEINKQFPAGFDFPPSTYDFDPLIAEITYDQSLIQNGIPSDVTESLLAQFRKDFLPNTVVTSGHFFNLNELVRAFELYNANWRLWQGNQLSLFWRQVVGYFEGLVSGVVGEVISQGIMNVLDGKLPVRQFDFKDDVTGKKELYFPHSDSTPRLVRSFGVDSYFIGGWWDFPLRAGHVSRLIVVTNLMSSISSELGRIYGALVETANQHRRLQTVSGKAV